MAPSSRQGLIFISCGQATEQERSLGDEIATLVREMTPHEPYFAQQQNSLDALTKNILGKLNDAVALIVIMHPRGGVRFPDNSEETRASVWIEQEIAIAAYITQILGRPLAIAPYIHVNIRLEGMREKLQLNPVSFRSDSEVLQKLRELLPTWKGLTASSKVIGPPNVRVSLQRCSRDQILFDFTNDEDEEVLILEIKLEQNDFELTAPLRPYTPGLWKIPAHSSRPFAKNFMLENNPAVSLFRMHDHEGISFKTHMNVSFTCEVKGHQHEIRRKLLVRVNGTNGEMSSVF